MSLSFVNTTIQIHVVHGHGHIDARCDGCLGQERGHAADGDERRVRADAGLDCDARDADQELEVRGDGASES